MNFPQGIQQLRELARMGEHGVIHIREQWDAGGPYRSWYPTLRPSRPALLVTLHTDSLRAATDDEAAARQWLIDVSRHTARGEALSDIDLVVTACRAGPQPEWAQHSPNLEATSGPLGGQDQVQGWQLDLRTHIVTGRHLFVTLNEAALAYGLLPTHNKQAWVIQPRLAQRYVDLYLKAHDAYRGRPRLSMNRGLYYWYRLRDCVPAFPSAWTYAVFGEATAPQAGEIRSHMQSLYARLMDMMMAHDRIGWLRYTPADNDTRDEMLNQLNSFIVLATGAFDSLGWLAKSRFQIQKSRRLSITVREERARGKDAKSYQFFTQLDGVASDFVAYLRTAAFQDRIELFYEPRNSIQHRLVLKGAHYNTGQYLSDCNVVFLDDTAAEALEAVEQYNPAEDPVWRIWGTRRPADGSGVLLEPYRFTGAALRFMFAFLDGGLERLNMDQWLLQADPSMKAEADAEIERLRCPSFATPFPWIPGVSVL